MAAPLDLEEAPTLIEERTVASQLLQDRLHAAALFAAGRVLEQQGDQAAALRKYQRAFRYDESPAVLHDILRLAASLDRYEEAVRYATLGADQLPADADILRTLGLVLTQQGDWEPALNLYETLLRPYDEHAPGANSASALAGFTELTIRQEATRLYFLTGRFAAGARVCAPIEAALADPDKFRLTPAQHKELLGEPGLTYHLFAECYLAAGDFNAAATSFETAHKHQPNAGMHGYNLARVDHKRGQAVRALEHLNAYFQARLAGEGAAPYALLGELMAALNQTAKFDERLAELRTADPENKALGLFIAQRYLAAEKYELAEPIFLQLAQTTKKRNLDEIYLGILQCRQKLQQPEPLLLTLGETESKASSDALEAALTPIAADEELRRQLVELARERRNPTAAKLPPANESWVIAELALTAKDLPTALEFFEFALQDQPLRRSELLETFGVRLFLADHTAEAAQIFRRGVEDEKLKESQTSFQFYLAGALAIEGETEEALQFARLAAKADPQDSRFVAREAWILQRAKRYEEALQAYLALLKQSADSYDSASTRETVRELRQTVSNIYVQRGEIATGIEYLEQVLDEFPSDAGALNDLGYLWADAGKHLQRARRMIERAVAAEPDNRAYLDSLGWVQYRLGNYPAAKTALEAALKDDDQPDSVMLDHLGDVYFKLNELGPAKTHWQRALDALPSDTKEPRRTALEKKLRN